MTVLRVIRVLLPWLRGNDPEHRLTRTRILLLADIFKVLIFLVRQPVRPEITEVIVQRS